MELWTSLSSALKKTLPKDEFDTWIKPLTAKKEGKFIKLSAPNDFILNHVKENYLPDMEKHISKNSNLTIHFNMMDKSTFVEKLDKSENTIQVWWNPLLLIILLRANQITWPWLQQNRWP